MNSIIHDCNRNAERQFYEMGFDCWVSPFLASIVAVVKSDLRIEGLGFYSICQSFGSWTGVQNITFNPYPPKCWRSWNFFIPIIYFTHFGAYINCQEFKKIRTSRTEDTGMCAIAHNGNTMRQKWMILRSDYIYCIYFHLFLLYNLKF